MKPAITGQTVAGRSLNGSPASIEASSITHAPSLGAACLPLLRRIVWWLACATPRCSAIGHPFRRAHDGVSPKRGDVNRHRSSACGVRHSTNRRTSGSRSAAQAAASSAALTSASAAAFCARGTVRTRQRSKPASACSASAYSGFRPACLTLYCPLICLATSSEWPTTSTSSAPSARARSSPRSSARYSATLFVVSPIGSPSSSTTPPSRSETTTPIAAGPGFPRAPPSTWTTSFIETPTSRVGERLRLAVGVGPLPAVAQLALTAAVVAAGTSLAFSAIDDDGHVRIVRVVRGELVVQLVRERGGHNAVDQRPALIGGQC